MGNFSSGIEKAASSAVAAAVPLQKSPPAKTSNAIAAPFASSCSSVSLSSAVPSSESCQPVCGFSFIGAPSRLMMLSFADREVDVVGKEKPGVNAARKA